MAESYPEELLYHPEHDWARIDGDEAVMGITWHAQDALGELVHYEALDVVFFFQAEDGIRDTEL